MGVRKPFGDALTMIGTSPSRPYGQDAQVCERQ